MIDLEPLAGGLIVSCQARVDNPLNGPQFMSAMAIAAAAGGAVGIRAEGPADVAAIRAAVSLPIIGIRKILDGRPVYITPTFETAREVFDAGADIIALDATLRDRDGEPPASRLIARIREELGVRVMADCDSLESAEVAAASGADLVSTTLAGYTGGVTPREPDLALIRDLARNLDVPVVAEGRLWTPEDVAAAYDAGAWSVVVGTAITNPLRITARMVGATPAAQGLNTNTGSRLIHRLATHPPARDSSPPRMAFERERGQRLKRVTVEPQHATLELWIEELGLVMNSLRQVLGHQEPRRGALEEDLRAGYDAMQLELQGVIDEMVALGAGA